MGGRGRGPLAVSPQSLVSTQRGGPEPSCGAPPRPIRDRQCEGTPFLLDAHSIQFFLPADPAGGGCLDPPSRSLSAEQVGAVRCACSLARGEERRVSAVLSARAPGWGQGPHPLPGLHEGQGGGAASRAGRWVLRSGWPLCQASGGPLRALRPRTVQRAWAAPVLAPSSCSEKSAAPNAISVPTLALAQAEPILTRVCSCARCRWGDSGSARRGEAIF